MITCGRCGVEAKRFRALPIVATPGEPETPAFELVCYLCLRAPKASTATDTGRLERAVRKVSRG